MKKYAEYKKSIKIIETNNNTGQTNRTKHMHKQGQDKLDNQKFQSI